MLGAALLLLVVGLLALAEVVVTIAWQEPLTALSAHRHQQALGDELASTQRALLSPSSADLAKMRTRQRIAALAGELDRRVGPGGALGRIVIPKLDVKFVFVAGATSSSLEKGPGHYDSTVLPGQKGTVGIAGHRTTYLAPFRKLNRLARGDEIVLTMPYGRFSYAVQDSVVVSPSHGAVLRPGNHDRLVLTTCTPLFSAAKRLAVAASEKSQTPLGAAVGDPFP
jgi:sortase A